MVADLLSDGGDLPLPLRRDLEKTDSRTFAELRTAICGLGLPFCHYENPGRLARNASQHDRDVVLSVYGGAGSRSRMALVPAVCEACGLSYVGPDAYGRIICQDKEVSKALALEAGLRTPSHRIVRSERDLDRIADFPLPCVAKPLWEGSSIGIGPDNLISARQQGEHVLRTLLAHLRQPIILEAFAPGREVSWCFIDSPTTDLRSFAELVWNHEEDYFDRHLYDAVHKSKADEVPGIKSVRVLPDALSTDDALALERLLDLVGPLGYGRIDGKLHNGTFVFLEITPDAWLGPTGTFASSFTQRGLSFQDVIAHVLLSAWRDPQRR